MGPIDWRDSWPDGDELDGPEDHIWEPGWDHWDDDKIVVIDTSDSPGSKVPF